MATRCAASIRTWRRTKLGRRPTAWGRSYDAQAFDHVRQQQCLAHIQRSIRDVLETKTGRARHCGEGLKALLQDAVQLWHAYRQGTVPDVPTEGKALQEELT